jgi:hypothetical protein
MLWHNSFAGQGEPDTWQTLPYAVTELAGPTHDRHNPPCLPVEIKRRINPNRASDGALGCAVTYGIDDEIGDTLAQKPGRGPLFYIVTGVLLVGLISGGVLLAQAYGIALPTFASFTSDTSGASSPAPVAAQPVALSDLQALQQQVAAAAQSTERLLAAQQAEIRRLSDQVVVLAGRLDQLQSPPAVAPTAVPAQAPAPALKPVASAKRKRPAVAQSSGAISTGGAPLPTAR